MENCRYFQLAVNVISFIIYRPVCNYATRLQEYFSNVKTDILRTFSDYVVHTDSNKRSYDYYESGGQEMVISYFMTGSWF